LARQALFLSEFETAILGSERKPEAVIPVERAAVPVREVVRRAAVAEPSLEPEVASKLVEAAQSPAEVAVQRFELALAEAVLERVQGPVHQSSNEFRNEDTPQRHRSAGPATGLGNCHKQLQTLSQNPDGSDVSEGAPKWCQAILAGLISGHKQIAVPW
jgi:hypothetical protein